MGFPATSRRTRRSLLCVPVLCSALVAVPTAALARAPHGGGGSSGSGGSGGAGLGGGAGSSSTSPGTTSTSSGKAKVVHLRGVVNASGDGITLTAAAAGTQNHPLTITGAAPAGDAGATIDIQAARPDGATWSQVATAAIGSNGAFTAHWTPTTSAQMELRAVLGPTTAPADGSTSGGGGLSGGSTSTASTASSGWTASSASVASTASSALETAPLTIPIFRSAVATIYGPGFWGHRTACGERLTRATLGVASRTLRCGAQVAVFYRGREITVPVIDRGPFANGASWDLTMATAKALKISGTATIGAVSLPSRG